MPHPHPITLKPDRIHYFDWLKVLVVYGIGIYHSALVFGYTGWLVNNHDRSLILTAFTGFTFPWGIPLLFFVAGGDAYFGLRKRGPWAFTRQRFARLILPLIVGVALLSPFQAWVSSGTPKSAISLWLYYPAWFKGVHLDWTPQWLGWYSYHLWFLGYLFVISIATLGFLAWVLRNTGRIMVMKLAVISDHWGALYLPVIPLAIIEVWLRPLFPGYQDWADVATYTYVFVFGFVFISDRRFEEAVRRNIGLALKMGLTASACMAALLGLASLRLEPTQSHHLQELFAMLWSLDIWSWMIAVLYLGMRWLDRDSRAMEYGAESIMPYYVINEPVIVALAAVIVRWQFPLWPKFALLVVSSILVTLVIYEFAVRRWQVMRLLFGLSTDHRPTPSGRARRGPKSLRPASSQP